MRSSNPALNDKTFSSYSGPIDETMTLQGTINKSMMLIALVFLGAMFAWQQAFPGGWQQNTMPQIPVWYYPCLIGTLILALVIIFKKTTAPFLAPVYAVVEGATLGALSALFEARYPGIVFQAMLGTAGVFVALLLIYKSGLIKVTDNFRLGVVAATGGIFIIYLISMVMGFFGSSIPMIHQGGTVGILFSLFVIGVASLNLVLDFDFIEQASKKRAPKYMEWYAAFGLLITLIWLYIEMLRLLSKTRK